MITQGLKGDIVRLGNVQPTRDLNFVSDIVDVPTDEGKAASLARVGLARPDAVFGNSIHDLAMLEMAAHAFPINPSPGLLEAAARNGWGYYRPQGAEALATDISGI